MVNDDLALSILDEIKAMRERIDEIERLLRDEMGPKDNEKGFSVASLLDLDPPLRSIVLDLMKIENATLSDLSKIANADEETIRCRLEILANKGYVKEAIKNGETRYFAVMSRKKPSKVPVNIWSALEGRIR